MAITPLPLPQPGDTNWAGPLNASLERLNQDVGEISETGQDILDAAGDAQQSATDAEAAAVRAEAAVVEATEQLPGQVNAEVALRVPPAVDSAISSADIPGQVAIALAAQAGKIVQGVGMPNGVVTADPGTLYVDTANTNGASVWRKASGTGNTGWTLLYGDTGWRDISALAEAGLTAHTALVRRVGDDVHFRFTIDVLAEASIISLFQAGAVDAGFLPPNFTYMPVAYLSTSKRTGAPASQMGADISRPWLIAASAIAGQRMWCTGTQTPWTGPDTLQWVGNFATVAADWPTTLPGSPA